MSTPRTTEPTDLAAARLREATELYLARLADRRPVVRVVRARCPNPDCGSLSVKQHHAITDSGVTTAYADCLECGEKFFVVNE